MAVISELLDLVEDKVQALLPTYKPMPFTYDIELNDRINNKNYGVRLGSASSTPGLNRCVTIDHNVEIDLTQRWEPKKSIGDKHLRDCIKDISNDLETIYKELYRRPGSLSSATLLLIAPLDLSAPTIDNDNNLVTITLTLSVKYRVLN
jgi:hypothetical protein